jgi:hypothetical protein
MACEGRAGGHELEEVEQEQRHVGVGPGAHVGHRRGAGDAGVQLAQVYSAGVEIDEHVDLQEALVTFLGPILRTWLMAMARWVSDSASGNRSLPHQPPLYGVSSG